MSEIVKLYNPANSGSLTPEQVAGLQTLTDDQLKELKAVYPNSSISRAYLLIIDKTKPPEKQLPSLSTFENLYNLRVKNGQKQWVAYAYKGSYKPTTITPVKARRTEVRDMTDVELMELPGLKLGIGKNSGAKLVNEKLVEVVSPDKLDEPKVEVVQPVKVEAPKPEVKTKRKYTKKQK